MKKQRNIIRIIHLIGAAAIGTFVYSPYGDLEWFKLAMQAGVIPLLTLSGMWLWKPKWFKLKSNQAKVLILALCFTMGLTAQEAKAQVNLKGGAGSFYIGYKTLETSNLDFFLPEGATSLESGLLQIGGDGYFFINRWIIGGGGHYSRGDNFTFTENEYGLHGGGGYFTLGYGVWTQPGFILFPYSNFGFEGIRLNKSLNEDVEFNPNQFTAVNYTVVSPVLDIGIGADWFPSSKGWKIGAKIGYQFALNQSPKWHHTSGNTVNDPQLPEFGLDGFYLRLNVGGGYIK